MDKTYKLNVAGLTRELPICKLNDELSIAGFVMFSDVELTIACATELLKKLPEFDVILTAESKGIPLAYEMSRQCGKKYILARKSIKLYMKRPVEVDVKSITTDAIQKLYLDTDDLRYLSGKRIAIIDDVISTGESLRALAALVEKSDGKIVAKATVLAEGVAATREDIIFLETLPLIPNE